MTVLHCVCVCVSAVSTMRPAQPTGREFKADNNNLVRAAVGVSGGKWGDYLTTPHVADGQRQKQNGLQCFLALSPSVMQGVTDPPAQNTTHPNIERQIKAQTRSGQRLSPGDEEVQQELRLKG